MSLFDTDLVKRDLNTFYVKLLQLNNFEYWQENPNEMLDTLFEIVSGHKPNYYCHNSHYSSSEDISELMKNINDFLELTKIAFDSIKPIFGFDGELELLLLTKTNRREEDANGNLIVYNKQNPHLEVWMDYYLAYSYKYSYKEYPGL